MTTYQHHFQPFVYFVGWTSHERWYIGSRYAAGCHPSDLWTSYFTSCKPLKIFAMQNGKPDVISVLYSAPDMLDVRARERQLIAEYKAISDPAFFNGGGMSLLDEEVQAIFQARSADPKMSVVDLAARYAVTRTTVYHILNGERRYSRLIG